MIRWLRAILFSAALLGTTFAPSLALAQEEEGTPAEGSGSSGDPLYGYVATGFLAAGIIFVVCKSARR